MRSVPIGWRHDGARMVLGTLVVVAVLAVSGCVAGPADVAPSFHAAESSATVTVERRDLTSVLVVSGQTVSQPVVVLRAPADGALHIDATEGARLIEGQVVGTVGGETIVAPASGEVVSWSVREGARAMVDVPIVSVRYDGFGVQAPVSATVAYRVYSAPTAGAVSIEGGPAGLSCPVLPSDQITEGADGGSVEDLQPVFVCLLPADTGTMAGLPAKVGLQTAVATAALVVPVEAVLGSASTGTVTRISGERREVVDVTLGISDGAMIEITDGLAEGDVIVATAPGLMDRAP